jgi:UDP-2-acetamido-3-amino-2,3-dideoxy-glucuronate N-acetyltransferase
VSQTPSAVQVALVGFGPWGRNIARNLDTLGALAVVCDPDPASQAAALKLYPHVRIVSAREEVPLDMAVAIAAPAAQHAELAGYFLARDQHVFVEKPLALNVTECPPLIAMAEQKKRVLMVGHLLQYHPAVLTLDRLIRQGALGRLLYFYSNRLNLGRIRREENSLWSFAPHDISVMLRLAGAMPSEVHATGGYFLHPKIADSTVTHLAWESGLRAHIYVSWLHPFKEQRLVVVGQDAMAVFDDAQPLEQKLVLYRHGVDWKDGVPVPRKAEPESVSLPNDEPLRCEMQAFLDACAGAGGPLYTDGDEGMRVLRVLDAAEKSLTQGGVPIQLAELAVAVSHPGVTVHPTAVVGEEAQIGAGSKIWHFSHIMDGAVIGRDCVIGQNGFVQSGAIIGDNVRLQNNVSIYDGVTLGDDVFCGPSCVFTNVTRPRAAISRRGEFSSTPVGRGVTIGANATIVCGHSIGDFAFIGAGSVVTRDVPAHALVTGNPARVRGWVCTCGEKLPLDVTLRSGSTGTCTRCNTTWQSNGKTLTALENS